jgi:hypothetical protein
MREQASQCVYRSCENSTTGRNFLECSAHYRAKATSTRRSWQARAQQFSAHLDEHPYQPESCTSCHVFGRLVLKLKEGTERWRAAAEGRVYVPNHSAGGR